jgi:DNA-binding NarL/FixJ family response regulator
VLATVVVQHRARLFREGVQQLLTAEDDIEVVGTASSAEELLDACRARSPRAVVMEAVSSEWETSRLPDRLRRVVPRLIVVGLTASDASLAEVTRAHRAGITTLVSHAGGIADILAAVRLSGCQPRLRLAFTSAVGSPSEVTAALTERELGILTLIGAGYTSGEISGRLTISRKTVENHKQRIFAKLGVQNQAHAVSIAIRTGLLRPERTFGQALAD